MAYYDVFVAAWNAGGLPVGASGTPITGGMTTPQKMAALNGWTIVVAQPTIIETYKIFNALDPAEFDALSAALKTRVRDILGMGVVDASPGTHAHTVLLAAFGAATVSRAALAAVANTFKTVTPWWQANGYYRAFDLGDCLAAGVS
jgi:hypothetical protein